MFKNQPIKYFIVTLFIISSSIIKAQTPCNNGSAGVYDCNGYDLMAHVDLSTMSANSGNDSWGWTDPQTGIEYALMGLNNGTAFIDISDPANPVYLGKLPSHTTSSSWRDIKVYENYAFIVSEASGHGMQVFDLNKLSDPDSIPTTFTEDAHYDGFGSAHNLVINPKNPVAYAVGTQTFLGGAHFVDISDPLNPQPLGGYSASSYSHDAQVVTYAGSDTDYQGKEIFIGSNEDEVVIVDVDDPSNPSLISNFSYTNVGYTHQGWLTEDHQYFLLGDELDELSFGFQAKTIVIDMSDLDNPVLDFNYFGPKNAIDHNGYTRNGKYYQANYSAGLRVIDITDIENDNFTEVGSFDTFPVSDDPSFDGAWNVYPYFDSGNIVISDINTGFYLVRPSNLSNAAIDKNVFTIYPHPASHLVNIQSPKHKINDVKIFTINGQMVKTFNNLDDLNVKLNVADLSSGIYMLQINQNIRKKLIIK
ncbi:MAG: choice-of-anchor B family protein [Psychroflexus sp.]|nr:choice-of-anchor B family protein [Psychroflexus sp.]MDR9448592.1 choice-of-anchor B family protein [Psychroflexus sp.]